MVGVGRDSRLAAGGQPRRESVNRPVTVVLEHGADKADCPNRADAMRPEMKTPAERAGVCCSSSDSAA